MRLTGKNENGYYSLDGDLSDDKPCANKLGQLEDIEEEFEIDNLEDLRDRLTKYKFLANHEMSCVDANAYNLMLEDLNKYHSIEEEIGIDLCILFNAMKNGIYHNQYCGISSEPWHFQLDIKNKRFYYHIQDMNASWELFCKFKDYGKTWALTKEELTYEIH